MTTNKENKQEQAKIKEIMKTAKTANGALFVQDVDTLNRSFAWLIKHVFNIAPKDSPVITIASATNGDKPVYVRYSPDLQKIKDKSCQAILANFNPYYLSNVKETLEAVSFVTLHYMALLQDKKIARKKSVEFKELGEKYGFIVSKTDDKNAGYEKVEFSPELWQKVFPFAASLAFNFEGIEKPENKGNNNEKKEFVFVHPNRMDYVKTDNKNLKLFK